MLTAIKGEINSNTIIVGDFNIPLSSMDRSFRQKINKETQALNYSFKINTSPERQEKSMNSTYAVILKAI